ncbi:glycosyltransferase [Cellulosimicrobium arenosum]|uniref:Glycosyltransferase family 4 protein n=1 Tax=Cellulosimicrobium arenosum TaxID=2708133 RepID=A0A927IZY0_9MICO|nr:glycosyltransferase family 4 protein [Cellulosimicrobium arenosum]
MTAPPGPVRVLVLDHTARPSGAELALLRLCEALGPDVSVRCVLFADGPLVGRLRTLGVPTRVLPLDRRVGGASRTALARPALGHLRSAFALVRFQRDLLRLIRVTGPDVVHTTSLKADLLALLPAVLARRPLVWHIHDRIASDYLPRALVRLVRVAALVPAALVANSRATASTLGRSAVVAYPGLAPGQVRPGRRTPPSGPPVVGLLGRISPTKGQLELVRAVPFVLRRHPGTTFRMVGAPTFGEHEYEAVVRAEAERLGVAPSITWVGAVTDPSDELDRLAVLVHASPVPEPFGQVVVEGMARGVPVVATDAGGVPEIVGRGAQALGELVAPGDVRALGEAIVAVLDDPVGSAERAERARVTVAERFTARRTAQTVTAVWWDVTRRSRRAPRP